VGDFRDGYGLEMTDAARRSGFITIEEAEEEFKKRYADKYDLTDALELKAWIGYCRSRNKNGNLSTKFRNYLLHLTNQMLHDQVKYGMIDCSDLGGKEAVLANLTR